MSAEAPAALLLRDVRPVPVGAAPGAATGPVEPCDVLVEHGTVRATGADLTGLARAAGAEVVAGEGRWLMPGLWDQHVHLGQWTLSRQRLDTSDVTGPDDAVRRVAERVAADPGHPVIGWGHRPGTWSREATVAELDAVSGVTPVVLIAGDGHHGWLNSAALAALGLGRRDDVVRENEWFAAYELLTALTGDDGTRPAAYRDSLLDAASRGVVGLVDFEFTGGVADWVERWRAGCDVLRVRMATYAEGLESVIASGLRSGDPLVPDDDRLVMGPLKIISDGSLNTRTAWCCEPYADGGTGAANLPQHRLQALLARAHVSGLQVATHAIGDAAVAAALDAYEATSATGSIEHAQLTREADVERMATLSRRTGLRASVQPAHLLDDRDLTEHIWPGRGGRSFAFRRMADAGVRLVLGSDAPVSPLDPWLAVAAAVHRSADERDPWHPEQALTVREALAASTDGQPTVSAGSRGDLALLDADPYALDVDRLRAMTVALTVVGGRVVHRAL